MYGTEPRLDITITQYNDLIPLLPWRIVISGFHCITVCNLRGTSTTFVRKHLRRLSGIHFSKGRERY